MLFSVASTTAPSPRHPSARRPGNTVSATAPTAATVREKRAVVLTSAFDQHPVRFVRKPPQPSALPTGSWINPPDDSEEATQ